MRMSGFITQRETANSKMKGVILLFLGLFFKVDVAANSTKVYMLNLEVESSATVIVSALLNNPINGQYAKVSNFDSTTNCTYILNDSKKNCLCQSGYILPEDIRKNYSCTNNQPCVLPAEETAVCLSETRVSIDGISLVSYEMCDVLCFPSQKETEDYQKKNKNATDYLATIYSTMDYFDSLVIQSYSSGSVFANYTVQYLGKVNLTNLQSVVQALHNSTVVTTGLVTITISQTGPIDIGSSVQINCTPPTYLGQPRWYLTDVNNKTTEITSGIEASLTYFSGKDPLDIVQLTNISGSWKGTLKCMYTNNGIQHTSSTKLDVALLPEIQAASNPQFPDCRTAPQVTVVIGCEISNSSENYTVTWDKQPNSTYLIPGTKIQGNFITYTTILIISCKKDSTGSVYVTCKFTNNRATKNKYAEKTVEIPIIYSGSTYCSEQDGWPLTKSGYSAILPCLNLAIGQNTRKCSGRDFQVIISTCVNIDVIGIKNDVEELNKGIGYMKDSAADLMERMKNSTTVKSFGSFANINQSINIYVVMNDVSARQSNHWNDTVLPNFINSASNFLNDTDVWKNPQSENSTDLTVLYMQVMEQMIKNSNLTEYSTVNKFNNVKLTYCNGTSSGLCDSNINASVTTDVAVAVIGYRNLYELLPSYQDFKSETTILSVTSVNGPNHSTSIEMRFNYGKERPPNCEMMCVFWDTEKNDWSQDGCKWGGANEETLCTCTHNSAFTILMSKTEKTLPYMEEITYVGLGISIISLLTCIIIEILVWDIVVKSDVSNFRHVAILNICFSLLFAHTGFLASSKLDGKSNWCSILTIVKHFFFLATFFWMLCLSFVILHQMIYVFDHLRKKVFWGLSIILGYVCPLLCVTVTVITFGNGQVNEYYSPKTCWLVYKGKLSGSIFGFLIPIGSIVFINLFTLAVVIMKIITPAVSEAKARDEKAMAKSMIKTIVFLSPVLGITWILGFFIMDLDLTVSPWAEIVNYSFTIFNSLQGLFILLTVCVGEKKIRDALRKRFKAKPSVQSGQSKSKSSTKMTSSANK